MNIECLILNVDGLWFFTHQLYQQLTREIAKQNQLNIPEDYFESLLGGGYDQKEETLYRFPALAHHEQTVMAKFNEHVFSNGASLINPAVEPFLQHYLDQGVRIALTSDYPKSVMNHLLSHVNLDPRIDVTLGSHDVAAGKPLGNINYKAAKRLNTKPLNTLVIDTTKNGVHAAYLAFMRCVFVSEVFPVSERIFKYSFRQISQLDELQSILDEENKKK